MNTERKHKLCNVIEKIRKNVDELQDILVEEQEYNNNIPDNLRESERAETSFEAINALTDAIRTVEEATNNLDEIVER